MNTKIQIILKAAVLIILIRLLINTHSPLVALLYFLIIAAYILSKAFDTIMILNKGIFILDTKSNIFLIGYLFAIVVLLILLLYIKYDIFRDLILIQNKAPHCEALFCIRSCR